MDWLDNASVGFLVVFLGTLFLVGELLVKMRGLFAVIGIVLMSLFFAYHIDAASGLWIVLLYGAGLGLIIFDGKVTGDGTIALLGALMMIMGIAVPAPGFLYGSLAAMGFILGALASTFFLRVFSRRELWSKITLKDKMTGDLGYNSINETYKDLVGQKGKTMTDFRPIGTIDIDGSQYSATSGGQWIKAGEEIEVIEVDGTRILVKKLEEQKES
ncbi:NfeD family protein [Thalassorhabdus alkalitolerans]|uniref:NfeD family protein n=2 Tax=Bacillaceae TaxID=186817 RepID=A0ABW0YPU0_9BACI